MKTIRRIFEISEAHSGDRSSLATLVRSLRERGYQVRPNEDSSKVVLDGTYTIWGRFPGAEDFAEDGWEYLGVISGRRNRITTRGMQALDDFLANYGFNKSKSQLGEK